MPADDGDSNVVDLVQRPRPGTTGPQEIPPAETLQLVKLYQMIENPADLAELMVMAAKLARNNRSP